MHTPAAAKGHVPEAGGLVPPGGTGNGVSCSQWNCTQGPGHTELHVRMNTVCAYACMYMYQCGITMQCTCGGVAGWGITW